MDPPPEYERVPAIRVTDHDVDRIYLFAEEAGPRLGSAVLEEGRLEVEISPDATASRVPLTLLQASLVAARKRGFRRLAIAVPAARARLYERLGFKRVEESSERVSLEIDLTG